MSEQAQSVRKYTWKEFYQDSELLAKKIALQKYESLIVVTRGGLLLGGMLSQYLHIPLIETVCVKSYKDKERGTIRLLKPAKKNLPNPIIIDEICDSGETLKFLVDKYQLPSAVIFYKPKYKIYKPDYFIHPTDQWIKFPWEVDA